jgi:thiol-disulfide isomerase/thioredoxin
MKKTLLIIAIGVLTLAAGFGVQKAVSILNKSKYIPVAEFSLPDTTGKQHAISEWQDKLRVINFWATWCPPCREELPALVELQTHYASKNVQLIGIAIDDAEPVTQFLKNMNINYPMLIAAQSGIELAFNLGNFASAIPYTIIVDKENNVVFQHSGEISKIQLQEAIDGLLVQ